MMISKMNCNFYNFFSIHGIIGWLLSSKNDRKIARYYGSMKKTIDKDLEEIKRNKENDVDPLLENKYYNILIKGKNTDVWRVYFLKQDNCHYNSYVVFPFPNGNVLVQKLNGSSYVGLGAKEQPFTRSEFWFPYIAVNFTPLYCIKQDTSDKMFVYDWIMSHSNYDEVNATFHEFDANVYVKLNV